MNPCHVLFGGRAGFSFSFFYSFHLFFSFSLYFKVFLYLFLMWTLFKVFIEFVTILFLVYVLVFGLEVCGMLALRQRSNPSPCVGRPSPNPWATRESAILSIIAVADTTDAYQRH